MTKITAAHLEAVKRGATMSRAAANGATYPPFREMHDADAKRLAEVAAHLAAEVAENERLAPIAALVEAQIRENDDAGQ